MAPLLDLSLRRRWRPGQAAGTSGPFLMSFTQFTPHRLRDLPAIWSAAERLSAELRAIESACGVLIYLQPARRRVGSLSAWTEEAGLAEFVALPYHREIMRRYRVRGLPLSSAKWWSDELDRGSALAIGQGLLDRSGERRVVVAPTERGSSR